MEGKREVAGSEVGEVSNGKAAKAVVGSFNSLRDKDDMTPFS